MKKRIAKMFARLRDERRCGLIAYVTCGDPDLATTREIVLAAIEAGADAIELGVPFSDPVADGNGFGDSGFMARAASPARFASNLLATTPFSGQLNLLTTGSFGATVDFGGGPLTSAGGADIFVVDLTP